MKYYRANAFTIMEMLVVLALSGILITGSMQLYLNYEKLIRMKNKQIGCGKETYQFYHIFKHEFDAAVSVKASGNEVTLLSSAKTLVRYEFEPDFIVRSYSDITDTFFIKVNEFKVDNGSVSGFDNAVTLELENCGETYPIYLVKQYPNDILMNNAQ
jgi:prepilin-type N-terminal cleavage/methylation domain-containing protein